MDVVLKVLEGSKTGAKVAVKKNEFIIGRGQTCHLCAGSSSISRQHCAIMRHENRVTIKDLGSRNGTLVNGNKIAEETELASGDEVTVGPLKFLVTISPGISNAKRAEVKSVAEAVTRTAETPSVDIGDEDISKWLLGAESALSETQTIRFDDTNAVQRLLEAAEPETTESPAAETTEPSGDAASDKTGKKPAPGKLPKVPDRPGAKDSREAAVEALRAWSRRR